MVVNGGHIQLIASPRLSEEDILAIQRGYELSGNGGLNTNPSWYVSDYIPVKPNTAYYVSGSNKTQGQANEFYDSNKTFVSTINKITGAVTAPANSAYMRINGRIDQLSNVQIAEGKEAKDYHPYTENPIELNSSPDGTIRDAIIGKPNEWYKREYIGKVVLDGSETYSKRTDGAFQTNVNGVVNRTVAVSNYFNYNRTSDTTGAFYTVDNYLRFFYNEMETVEDFKTWLSTHNTIVWYQKSQYTDIPITDTTLINQLNDIYNNAHSYNGVTNITTTYEDGNEQMYLDIEALKNVWEVTE